MKSQFQILGMSCAACSARVDRSVRSLPGIESCAVNLLRNTMVVEYNPEQLQPTDLIRAVQQAGYDAFETTTAELNPEQSATSEEDPKTAQLLRRLLLSLLCEIPLFYLAMGPMMGLWVPSWFEGVHSIPRLAGAQLLLLLPILLFHRTLLKQGLRACWERKPNMDSLITIGTLATLFLGAWGLIQIVQGVLQNRTDLLHTGMHNLYFEGTGMILTLITMGKYWESRAKKKTTSALEDLMQLAPQTARIWKDEHWYEVPVSEVKPGDRVEIRTGTVIPVDGIVLQGRASVQEAAVTGEPLPVQKEAEARLVSGSHCVSGWLEMQATKTGAESTLAQVIQLVDQATTSQAPIARLADRVSFFFVPAVLLIAAVTTIVWLVLGAEFSLALRFGVSVLVLSCPCALGLATPTAIMVGMGKAARLGLLYKSADVLETLATTDTLCFDKTGTLTEGRPRIVDQFLVQPQWTSERFLQVFASLEHRSEHPLARAFDQECVWLNLPILPVEPFEQLPGLGLHGWVEGVETWAGNFNLFSHLLLPADSRLKAKQDEWADQGKIPLFLFQNQACIGVVAVSDPLLPSARTAVEALHKRGLSLHLLTGDQERTAQSVQEELGLDAIQARLLPQDKEQALRLLQEQGHTVAMIGDGINDAPALARADIGIAMGSGTDLARETGNLILLRQDLFSLVDAIDLSRATMRNIRQNLFWAFLYNVLGIPVAAGCLYSLFHLQLSPMLASFAMGCSSLFVVCNALRLNRFQSCPRPTRSADRVESEQNPIERNDKMKTLLVKIEGMMCAHCAGRVQKELEALEGIQTVEVSLENKSATITLNANVNENQIRQAIETAGYTLQSLQTL